MFIYDRMFARSFEKSLKNQRGIVIKQESFMN